MKRILFTIFLTTVLLLLISCSSGISQEQYKLVADDLVAAKSQIQTLEAGKSSAESRSQTLQTQISDTDTQRQALQTQFNAAQSKIASLQDQLAAAQTQADSLKAQLTANQTQALNIQSQLSTAQAQIQSLQSSLDTANGKINRVKLFNDIWNPLIQAINGSNTLTASQELELTVKLSNSIKAIADPGLTSRYDKMINATTKTDVDRTAMDLFIYMVTLQTNILQ